MNLAGPFMALLLALLLFMVGEARHIRRAADSEPTSYQWRKNVHSPANGTEAGHVKYNKFLLGKYEIDDAERRAYEKMNKPRVPHQGEIVEDDLTPACAAGFSSPSFGRGDLYEAEDSDGECADADCAEPARENPRRGKAEARRTLDMAEFEEYFEPLFSAMAGNSEIQFRDGKPHVRSLYRHYMENRNFMGFLADMEKQRVGSADFVTREELDALEEVFASGKSYAELQEDSENKETFERLVFNVGTFSAFNLAKAMSAKMDFGVTFDETMTLQRFSKALRHYFHTIEHSGEKADRAVKKVLTDTSMFYLAYLRCDGVRSQIIFSYFTSIMKRADLSTYFLSEVDEYMTNLAVLFNAWSRAPDSITPRAMRQARAYITAYAEANKSESLTDASE
ncbi:hypothetical protein PAPHI01_2401 [Pancytospora philotis]|nr:hypothetical protein PAPHI01_2401 [Pancytospora philotis]